jgi:ureidoacrylate peracid hydrolase
MAHSLDTEVAMGSPTAVTVDARPDSLAIHPQTTAVIVVDMQNDFAAPGGMFDSAGVPIESIQAIVAPTRRLLSAARASGLTIIYLKMQFAADLSDAGPAGAPNRLKHAPLGLGDETRSPQGDQGRVLIEGTWDTEIVAGLAPEPGDRVISKHRYSGFFETELDDVLRQAGAETLIFAGATTSVCVESTLRDAFYRNYRCLILSDCTAEPLGGQFSRGNHEASLLTIETLFGWVSDSGSVLAALDQRVSVSAQG